MLPPALTRERENAGNRRLGDDSEVDRLRDVRRRAIDAVENGGAIRTCGLHVRPKHEVVDEKRVLAGCEEIGEAYGTVRFFEDVVLFERPTWRERPALGCNRLELPPERDFALAQLVAGRPVFRALSRKSRRSRRSRERLRGFRGRTTLSLGHMSPQREPTPVTLDRGSTVPAARRERNPVRRKPDIFACLTIDGVRRRRSPGTGALGAAVTSQPSAARRHLSTAFHNYGDVFGRRGA